MRALALPTHLLEPHGDPPERGRRVLERGDGDRHLDFLRGSGRGLKTVLRKGAQSVTIANSTPNDGVYEWTVPTGYATASDYLVEISSVTNPSVIDTSDGTFTVQNLPIWQRLTGETLPAP